MDQSYQIATEAENNWPCPSCGGELYYSAKNKKISCDYCGYKEDVAKDKDQIVERSLNNLKEDLCEFVAEDVGKKNMGCTNCGANFMVEKEQIKVTCAFCGSNKVNQEAFETRCIEPSGIIPFYVSKDEGILAFQKWIKQGWFHPNKLKKLASIEGLHGVYLPFWTFDAQTNSIWSGEAGYHYTETRQVNGKTVQVQRTRWTRRSGRLDHFFDDTLVVASKSLKQQTVNRILPYRLDELVNFDPRLMIRWEAELYEFDVHEGYKKANIIMDGKIRQMCSGQLGGDVQRNLHVSSQKSGQTFKHVILPVWISSYYYKKKLYHFTINGQTGRVYGQKPLSYLKIAFLIFLFAAFIFGVWYLRESGVMR